MAKAVLVIAVPAGVVDALITTSTALPKNVSTNQTLFGPGSTVSLHGGDYSAYFAGLFVVFLVSEVVTAIATATCYRIIANVYLGQPVTWRAALRSGAARVFSIVWIALLILLVMAATALAVAAVALVLAAVHVDAGAVIVGVLGGVSWLVFVVWFATASRLAVPTLMIENIRGWKAIRRSVDLCRGAWWSVFGTELVASLIVLIVSAAVGIVALVGAAASHDSATAAGVIGFFTRTISLVIATPFSAAVLVVIAIDLRVRKEGFDIQLLASQMGLPPTSAAPSFVRPPGASPGPFGTPGAGWPPTQPYPPPGGGYPPPIPPYPEGSTAPAPGTNREPSPGSSTGRGSDESGKTS